MFYKDLLGVKFTPHGRNKKDGFDCYGLAIEILKRNGIILNDVFYEKIENEEEIKKSAFLKTKHKKIETLKKNCIILLRVKNEPTHIAVYIGNNFLIHATKNYGVIIEPIYKWKKRIEGIYEICN